MNERQRRRMDLLLGRFVDAMTAWNWSPRSIVSYEQNVRVFLDWLEEETDITDLAEVSAETLSAYQTWLLTEEKPSGERLSAATQRARLSTVKRFFLFLAKEGQVLSDRAATVSLPKLRRRLPQPLISPAEALRLLQRIDTGTPLGLRDRAMIEVLYASGIRNAELRALVLGDLDAATGTLMVRHGKGDKDRVVPIGPIATKVLTSYIQEARPILVPVETPLIFVTKNGSPLRALDVINAVIRAAKAAGIKKRLRPHHLRHACATHMLKGGADIRHIQMLLGHASLHTTQLYTKVEISDLKEVHRRFHPRRRPRRKPPVPKKQPRE